MLLSRRAALDGMAATVRRRPPLREEYVEVPGARLWAMRTGRGPALVLLHGGPGGSFTGLWPVVAMLDDLVRVHGYDQRACGRSTGEPPFTMARWVADLDALLANWGLESWIVAGHSFGAVIALAYALAHPDATRALVIMSCLIAVGDAQQRAQAEYRANQLARIAPDRVERFHALRARRAALGTLEPELDRELASIGLAAEFGSLEAAARHVGGLLEDMTATNRTVNRELAEDWMQIGAAPGFVDRVRHLRVPALLVHGERDIRPMWAVEELATLLPRARVQGLQGAGHLPWLEAPGRLRACLRGFVAELDAG